VFRRRRRQDADQAGSGYDGPEGPESLDGGWEEDDAPEAWEGDDARGGWEGDDARGWQDDAVAEDARGYGAPGLSGGPWDAEEAYPERERADFGSLMVPVTPMQQIELATDGQRFIWVTVKSGSSELRVHAFAAPKSGGLWDEVRQEISAELSTVASTNSQEVSGPFGTEVFAYVPVDPANPAAGSSPVRFIGVEGPRWLLRALIIGPAASGDEPVQPLEEILSDVVVVRGDGPMPPRDMLELRLPPEVQQALEQQAAAAQATAAQGGMAPGPEGQEGPEEGNRFQPDLNPFERGPEFTETR
jgi:hypothetical protein